MPEALPHAEPAAQAAPPTMPEPVAPVRGEPVDGAAVAFFWSAVPDAEAYWLQVAADADFEDVRFNARVGGTRITLFDLFSRDDARYHWRVRHRLPSGRWHLFGEPATFRALPAEALAAPRKRAGARTSRPLAPVGGAPVDAAAVPLRWTSVPGATGYRLQVAADRAFERPLFDVPLGPSTSMTLYGLLPERGQTFYWRVESTGGEGAKRWSEAATFRAVPDEVADVFALEQEAARVEADREQARREAAQREAAEPEVPHHRGQTSKTEAMVGVVVVLFTILITMVMILFATLGAS